MKPVRRPWLAGPLGLLAVVSAGAVGAGSQAEDVPLPALRDKGGERFDYANGPMGLICWTAILQAMSEIGRRCETAENSAFRAALDGSLSRLERHLRERGGWSEEQLARFRTQMSESDKQTELVCGNADAKRMYQSMSQAGVGEMERATNELMSRPGPPEWGSCL